MKLEVMLFRAVLTLAGASLGVNSYFIKSKVDEICEGLKTLSDSTYRLGVDNAIQDALINVLRTRIEIVESRTGNLDERVRAIEVRMGKR